MAGNAVKRMVREYLVLHLLDPESGQLRDTVFHLGGIEDLNENDGVLAARSRGLKIVPGGKVRCMARVKGRAV